jgi:hypothetical protein
MNLVQLSDAPKWTDVLTAWATLGAFVATAAAVIVALWVAIEGNRRTDDRLREDRERADRERRVDRDTALLLEVYDLFAAWKGSGQDETLFKLRPRLAVLPPTVATLVRFGMGDVLVPDPDSKMRWACERGQLTVPERGVVGWNYLQHELPADLWYIRHDRPRYDDRQWWTAYEEEASAAQSAPGSVQ